MNTQNTIAQIYVGTYAKYNNGSIGGDWIDLSNYDNASDFIDACKELHSDEEDPELMFQDYEGFPESLYSESMSTSELERIFEYLAMDEDDRKLIEMYCEATGEKFEDVELSDVQDKFHGTADDGADFAERMADELGEIPKDMPSWIVIDWDASWECNLRHDYNYAICEDTGDMYFFHNH